MFKTSDLEIQRIAEREGYRAKAYKPIPGVDPKTGKPLSNWTVGHGQENELFPGTPGAIRVVEGLEIDRGTAWNALCFFVYNVVDPLVTAHFNPQTQAEHDACASFVYNIHHDRLGQYTLPKLVCEADRSPQALQAITDCWLQYCLTPGAETGLARRRLVEAMDFRGIDIPNGVMGQIMGMRAVRLDKGEDTSRAVWFHPNGRFALTADPYLLIEAAQGTERRPKTEDEITADLNNAMLEKLGGAPAPKKAAPPPPPAPKPKPAPEAPVAPKVDTTLPPKPMEESKTHKGLSKADSGKETVAIGATVTGIGALLPNIQALTSYLEKFPVKTILMTIAIIGAVMLLVGAWRWFSGRMIAYEGRQEAERAKV